MLQIGEVVKKCGIGVETVRFYEHEGLISMPVRSSYPILNAIDDELKSRHLFIL